jgi:O-antigen/teichoic acid export membrane protein
MKLLFRDLLKDLLIYGAGDIFLKAATFFTLPFYTRIFTPEEYGIWSFVVTAVGLLNSILILGGDSAYARFFFEAKGEEEKRLITSTWFGFLALWSGSLTIFFLPFAGLFSVFSFGTKGYALLFILTLLAAPVALINTMCGQALRNRFQAQTFVIINVASTLLSIGFSLFGAIVLNLGLTGVLGGTFFAALAVLPLRIWSVRDLLCPTFSLQILRKLLKFGVPIVPSSLAYWVFAVSDRILLGKLSNLEQLGLYTVANQVTGIIAFFNGALGQAWSPHAIRVYEEQRGSAPIFFGRVLTYLLCGFGLLSVILTTFANETLTILSTPPFYPAAVAFGPLALGLVAYASTQVTALGISFTKTTKYFAIFSWSAALLNLGLNVLLIPKWGMIAACWTTLAAYLFLTAAYHTVSQRFWPVVYEKRRLFVAGGLTLIFTLAVPLLPALSLVSGIIIKSLYCFAFVGLLFLLRGLEGREWRGFLTFIRGRAVARGAT